MPFTGFTAESFRFFRDLAVNNHRLWFEQHRQEYEAHVLAPFEELRETLAPFMRELDPHFTADPPGSSDQQFSRLELAQDAPPEGPHFKTSLYLFWWNTQLPRLSDGHLHIGLGGSGVTLGFSIYDWHQERGKMREVFKPRLMTELELLDDYIKANYLRRGFEFRRFVRGVGRLGLREDDAFPTHGRDWQNTLGWVVSRQIHEGSSRLTPGSFLSECEKTFERLHPLYVFACDTRIDWRAAFKS